mmetsp:Transcript_102014/g.295204  ORF Transcript_102014/g.295204 Transcript_102014/m.295204 type:complete len:599 (+) Transcript_102014:1602-3398(+)
MRPQSGSVASTSIFASIAGVAALAFWILKWTLPSQDSVASIFASTLPISVPFLKAAFPTREPPQDWARLASPTKVIDSDATSKAKFNFKVESSAFCTVPLMFARLESPFDSSPLRSPLLSDNDTAAPSGNWTLRSKSSPLRDRLAPMPSAVQLINSLPPTKDVEKFPKSVTYRPANVSLSALLNTGSKRLSVRTVTPKTSDHARPSVAVLACKETSVGSPPTIAKATSSSSASSMRRRCTILRSCMPARRLASRVRTTRLQATVCSPPKSTAVAGAPGAGAKTMACSVATPSERPAATICLAMDGSEAEAEVMKGNSSTTMPVPSSEVTASSASTEIRPCKAPSLFSAYPNSARTATGTVRKNSASAAFGGKRAWKMWVASTASVPLSKRGLAPCGFTTAVVASSLEARLHWSWRSTRKPELNTSTYAAKLHSSTPPRSMALRTRMGHNSVTTAWMFTRFGPRRSGWSTAALSAGPEAERTSQEPPCTPTVCQEASSWYAASIVATSSFWPRPPSMSTRVGTMAGNVSVLTATAARPRADNARAAAATPTSFHREYRCCGVAVGAGASTFAPTVIGEHKSDTEGRRSPPPRISGKKYA